MKFFTLIPKETQIDFVGKFKYFLIFSILALMAVIAGVAQKGLNFGVDFTGGTVIQAQFTQARTAESVRSLVAELGDKDASVVSLGTQNTDYLITSRTDAQGKPLNERLQEKEGTSIQIQSVDVVGPKVGADLKKAAALSLIYSILLIAAYIWLRFDFRFAPGATLAMLHDLVMATGFYLVTGKEFTITAVAALLTIAGYSVNDTIVIYDRVRELVKSSGNSVPLGQIINKSVNLTLSRTVITSFSTLLSVIPISIFCKGEIQSFAQAIAIGIFVGTYSTVFIASPLTIYVDEWIKRREGDSPKLKSIRAKA